MREFWCDELAEDGAYEESKVAIWPASLSPPGQSAEAGRPSELPRAPLGHPLALPRLHGAVLAGSRCALRLTHRGVPAICHTKTEEALQRLEAAPVAEVQGRLALH